MESQAQGAGSSNGSEARAPAHAHTREPRISRKAIVVAQAIGCKELAWFRVELLDSSEHGLGLRSLIPIPREILLALKISGEDTTPELLLCHARHCTKLKSGWYHIGVQIQERMSGQVNTTRIPDAWRQLALQAAAQR